MRPGALRQQVDEWLRQSILAARYLARLYRRLGDDKQAATAIEVLELSERRAKSIALVPQSGADSFAGMLEWDAEAMAWETLVESQAGLCAFHAMVVEGPGRGAGLWNQRSFERGLQRALRGLRVAFPEDIARGCHQRAIERVSALCSELLIKDLGDEGSYQERRALFNTAREGILECLRSEADSPFPG